MPLKEPPAVKRHPRHILAMIVFSATALLGLISFAGPASAQELDLCALLGDPYCPAGVAGATDSRGGGVGTAGRSGGVASNALPRTGSHVEPLVVIGVGLVTFGGAAAIAARRRTERATA